MHAAIQSAEGEAELLAARRDLDEVIRDRRTPRRIAALLAEIAPVKRYGEANGLRATESYQSYVQLRRPYVVYVVSACAPLKFKSKTWSFPIAGDFPYLGWFNQESASEYGLELEKEGWDVDVRGASAYSTLGWFNDPVLSSMIAEGPEALGELVDVVLHESVHATLHLEGQAFFNESLASFVASRLTPRYLEATRGPLSAALGAYEELQRRSAEGAKILHATYQDLAVLYASTLPDAEKLLRKAALFDQLRARLHSKRRFTNATLVQHKTYSSGEEGFQRVLAACKGDLRCFFARLRTLTGKSFKKPHQEELEPVLLPLASPVPQTDQVTAAPAAPDVGKQPQP